MNIKQQALEAARPYAHNFNDLLEKAAKIEAFLNESSHAAIAKSTPQPIREMYDPAEDKGMLGPIVDERTQEEIDFEKDNRIHAFDEDGNDIIDDDASELINLAKNLVSDLDELGFNTNLSENTVRLNEERHINERAKARLKELSEAVGDSDIFSHTAPIEPLAKLDVERHMANFEITRGTETYRLRPIQLQIGQYMQDGNVMLNVGRQFGTTTMLAAFARQQRVKNGLHNILVITNNFRAVTHMQELIDDAGVNVFDFEYVANLNHAGETYDYIIVDNAANIPYAIEWKVYDYINSCRIKGSVDEPNPTKVIVASAPGQDRGLFYEMFTNTSLFKDYKRLSLNWEWYMSAHDAEQLKSSMGEDHFANGYDNKFRKTVDITGDLTI